MAKTVFSDGNPSTGTKGTVVTAAWLNGMSNHVHDGADEDGHAPLNYAVDTGAANAYAIALSPTPAGHVAGMPIWFCPGRDNTGAATIAISSLPAIDIRYRGNSLTPGHLRANIPACIVYTGSIYEVLTPCRPAGEIFWHPGASAPAGALKLNGALLARSTYAALWAWVQANTTVVSEANWSASYWGRFSVGNGSTTFRLPDLRGEFLRGFDDGRGEDPSRLLGQFQQGTHITGDNGLAPATHGIALLSSCNVDPPDGTARTIYFHESSVSQIDATVYWGRVRPRNIAWLPCITY